MSHPSDPSIPATPHKDQGSASARIQNTEVHPAKGDRVLDTQNYVGTDTPNQLEPITDVPMTRKLDRVPEAPFADVPVQLPPAGRERLPRPFGEYELLEEIARGGMGVVYKARQSALDRIVALKMILPGQLQAESSLQRFYREARAAAKLDHPNIVPVYAIDKCEDRHYFTMAFIETGSLKSMVQSRGPLPAEEAVALMIGVAEGVDFAHQRGLIHRDLKPDNVLIDPQGRPRIADFGLAKEMAEEKGLTASNAIVGTPAYMAPEQALGGNRQVGTPADIYALGGILYFLLTGKPPFQGDTLTEILCQVVKEAPKSPRLLNPHIPPHLEAICLICLEKEPANRYPSAAALAEALRTGKAGSWCQKPTTSKEIAVSGALPAAQVGDSSQGLLATAVSVAILDAPGTSRQRSAVVPPRRRNPLKWVLVGAAGIVIALGAAWLATLPGVKQGTEASKTTAKGVSGAVKATAASAPVIPVAKRRDFGVKLQVFDKTAYLAPLGALAMGQGAGLGNLWQAGWAAATQIKPFAHLDKDGMLQLTTGQLLQYQLEVEEDAYVGVWDCSADGQVRQLFPNSVDSDSLIKKGQPRVIPDETLRIRLTTSPQPEHVWVLASSERWELPGGKVEGPFSVISTIEERERWQAAIEKTRERAMVLESAAPEKKLRLSEEVIKYKATPASK